MSHEKVRGLKAQAIDAVKDLYDLHDDVDHEILFKVLGEIIVETEYSIAALKDTAKPGEEEPEEVVEEKPKKRVRKRAKKEPPAQKEPRARKRRGVRRKKD